jgi:hypothetical protein
MSDIKDLLGKAIGDEPPLSIDRDEVFRAGRQRVRRRRALAAGGVVAAVVVAAVGAATLTNLITPTPEPVPPAMGDSQHAPPGPDLPLSSTSVPSVGGPAPTAERAGQLTVELHDYIGRVSVRAWPGHPDPPAFRVEGDGYLYESDLTGDRGEGVLQVSVGYAKPGTSASCLDTGSEYQECEVSSDDGLPVALATWKSADGEKRNLAVVVLPDGTKVAAMSSNFSRLHQDSAKQPSGEQPVLDLDELKVLVAKAGFSVF